MEITGNNGSTDTNENMDFHVVVLMNEDGSEEVFKFPKSPPRLVQPQPQPTLPPQPPIVIEDSSDTESEAEEEVEQEKKEEKKKEEKKNEEKEAGSEAEEKKEEKEEEEKEEAAKTKEEAQTEAEEESALKKRRTEITSPAWDVVPTPKRLAKANDGQSVTVELKPAPSLTPAPLPSDLFPQSQLPELNVKMQLLTDVDVAMNIPAQATVLLSCPPSPLPDFQADLDIETIMKEHGM